MNVDFETELHEGYVRVVFKGAYSVDAILSIVSAGIDFAIANDRSALLVDIREITGSIPSTNERYEMGSKTASIQHGKDKLVAIALLGNEPWVDRDRFGETVAVNRAAVARVFASEADAMTWLEHAGN